MPQESSWEKRRLVHGSFGSIVPGVLSPVLVKHNKSFNLIDSLSVGIDRIQRKFEPLPQQIDGWRQAALVSAG